MRKVLRVCAGGSIFTVIFLCAVKPLMAGAQKSPLEIIGKTHLVAAFNSLHGPGSEIPGLAATYDMSLFEFSLGGKQSTFNGSGITTNANYPLADGDAFTQNTRLGLSSEISPDLKTGFLAELYSLVGDRTVGRVFGEELPWDDFSRESGEIQSPHFQANFYHGFLEGEKDAFKFKIIGGVLPQRELPEFSRKEMNQVKLGSLVYRPPITHNSFFEKDERKIEEGRHPLNGFDFIGDYEYLEKKHLHWEILAGASEPTPQGDLERDAYGGRAAVDILEGNVGFSYVYNDGRRAASGAGENQSVWALDASYSVCPYFIPYLTFAQTDYERETTAEEHEGDAVVIGALFKLPQKSELKAQYQRVEENYDLMAYHKIEHYPSNFDGWNLQATWPVWDTLKLKGVFYRLSQLDTETTAEDALFGDSYFPSISNSFGGTIGVERLGGDFQWTKALNLSGYVEHVKFRKPAPTAARSIDKDVYNFYGAAAYSFTQEWSLEGNVRHFFSVGNWQAMNFRSYQDTWELALAYKVHKDKHAYLIYQYYDFDDHNEASLGRNDYFGHQVILEFKMPL